MTASAAIVTRAAFVAEARTWLGVPWVHQGRARSGVDCIGLLLCVGWALELTDFDFRNYRYSNDPQMLFGLADAHMSRIDLAQAQPGDVVAISYPGVPHHMGLLGDYAHGGLSLIHSLNLWGRQVVEHRLDDAWRRRIKTAYAVPGVA